MLLPSPSIERQPRASVLLLPGVLLCVVLATVCASPSADSRCPRPLDCAQRGRDLCAPGSSHCGPCLTPLVEDEEGRCVARSHHRHHGKPRAYLDLDEDIDYLQSVISKQEVAEQTKPQKQAKHRDVKNHTGAPKQKQRNQERLLIQALSTNTTTTITNTTTITTTATPAPATAPPTPPVPLPRTTGGQGRAGPVAVPFPGKDRLLVIMISLCILVGTLALIMAAVCWVRLQRERRLAQKVDYPAFGGIGKPPAPPNGTAIGDNTLAQSAQMYHYQHQKQQMISVGKSQPEQKVPESEVTSDEEEVGGDFTVYECPGLAPTGEMEVKNPLFDDTTLHYHGNQK